jgi:hypothetical protein
MSRTSAAAMMAGCADATPGDKIYKTKKKIVAGKMR